MKRLRTGSVQKVEAAEDYSGSSGGGDFVDDEQTGLHRTDSRNDAKKKRIQSNREWKSKTKMSWNDEDPNPRHSLYYRMQLPELIEQWPQFQAALARGLPVAFRLGHGLVDRLDRNSFLSLLLRRRLRKMLVESKGRFLEANGEVIGSNLLRDIPWLKNEAWALSVDSTALSKNPSLRHIGDFLREEVELGHLVRQEEVSMIPARVLDVQPHHVVVDVCSAPGSKTEQVLALMHAQCSSNDLPTGVVIANDADPKRISRLCERYSRCGSANLMMTCGPAEDLVKKLGESSVDRIICDVPCTGDGTFRKAPHLWRLFRSRMAVEIHPLQLQIALSALRLLKPGGRMVYSTCSINPIEDEAVVAALLREYKGRLRLINMRAEKNRQLSEGLITRQGLHTWRCDTDVFLAGETTEKGRRETTAKMPAILESMKPPSSEEAQSMHLERCLRVLPHDQDTGGFFVAVLELDATPSLLSRGHQLELTKLVTAEQAKAAQAKLGYNPKKAGSFRQTAATEASGAFRRQFADFPAGLKDHLRQFLGSDAESSSTAATAALWNGLRVSATGRPNEYALSLLAPRARELADKPELVDTIVHCGINLGFYNQAHDQWWPNPDHILCLHPFISATRSRELLIEDFAALSSVGLSLHSEDAMQRDAGSVFIPITLQDAELQANVVRAPRQTSAIHTAGGAQLSTWSEVFAERSQLSDLVLDVTIAARSAVPRSSDSAAMSLSPTLEKAIVDLVEQLTKSIDLYSGESGSGARSRARSDIVVFSTLTSLLAASPSSSSAPSSQTVVVSKQRMSRAERKRQKKKGKGDNSDKLMDAEEGEQPVTSAFEQEGGEREQAQEQGIDGGEDGNRSLNEKLSTNLGLLLSYMIKIEPCDQSDSDNDGDAVVVTMRRLSLDDQCRSWVRLLSVHR